MIPSSHIAISPQEMEIIQKILCLHASQYEAWAFGSRATGNSKRYSDLDLAIITNKPLDASVMSALAEDFAQSDLPYKVDLVDWAATKPSFQKIIESQKAIIRKGSCS